MRLVYVEGPKEGLEVKVGDRIPDGAFVNEVTYFAPPHKPSSSGKVTVKQVHLKGRQIGITREFYVSMIGAKWIEREDQT